jgi:5'-deoxynucleotidase YfbR-like HD superfamily hydrolase
MDHAARVALFCYLIEPTCTAQLIIQALCHDIPEYEIGDIPSPTKRLMDPIRIQQMEREILAPLKLDTNFAGLSERENYILKLADVFDGLLFCTQEQMLGNRYLHYTVRVRYNAYAIALIAEKQFPSDLVETAKLIQGLL